LNKKGPLYNIL